VVREVLEESRQEFPRFKKDGTRHKKNWVKRQCQVCDQWVSSGHIAVDHIDPVISVDHGKQDWNEYIDRLWCDKKNLQRVCDPCHDLKTSTERIERLTKKYTEELNGLEHHIDNILNRHDSNSEHYSHAHIKELKKLLSKYTAKKKTIGLESVVQRARDLKDKIQKELK
jgi:hypothetical protein